MTTLLSDKIQASLGEAHKQWGWFLALGIGLIVLGALLIIYEEIGTLASVFALGAFLLVGGVMQLFAAFQARGAGHVILYLLFGALELIVGFMLMQHPVAGALTVTLTLAIYLIFSGLFRTIYSLWAQLPYYGWAVFSGLVSLLLGILLWAQWPSSAVWFLGFAVGISFIFAGISWVRMSLVLKSA